VVRENLGMDAKRKAWRHMGREQRQRQYVTASRPCYLLSYQFCGDDDRDNLA